MALILAPPKLVLTCAPRLVFATSPFIALLVRQASRLVRITKPSILIVTCQAFLFRSAPLLFVLPPQLVLSLPLLIKAASISLSLIASLKFGVATLFLGLAFLIEPAAVLVLLNSSLLVIVPTLFLGLAFLIVHVCVLVLVTSCCF